MYLEIVIFFCSCNVVAALLSMIGIGTSIFVVVQRLLKNAGYLSHVVKLKIKYGYSLSILLGITV